MNMLRTAVGLDIGHSYLKLVQLQKKRRGPIEVVCCDVQSTPPGCLEAGVVVDPQTLEGAIAELFEKNRAKRDCVCIAISGAGLDLRQLELPVMVRNELKQAIAWELKELIIYESTPLEDIFFDFHLLTKGKSGELARILVVSASKSQIYGYIDVCKGAGLSLEIIDMGLLSLPHIFPRTTPLCHIILGARSIQILIRNANGHRLGRLIPVGCENLVDALAKDEGLSQEQARHTLSNDGLDYQGVYGEEMKKTTSQMVTGIMQSLEYERIQQRLNSIGDVAEEVFICGGGALFPHMAALLEDALHLPVRILDPYAELSIDKPVLVEEWGPMLVPAFALAYRGLKER